MPVVAPGSKVLVTGASGFIAAWVVKVLLERGFHVRGTVRSSPKGKYLAKLFKDHGDRFEYVVVEDIAKASSTSARYLTHHDPDQDGAFDEAVKGVDAVEHTASPFHLHADDPEGAFRLHKHLSLHSRTGLSPAVHVYSTIPLSVFIHRLPFGTFN